MPQDGFELIKGSSQMSDSAKPKGRPAQPVPYELIFGLVSAGLNRGHSLDAVTDGGIKFRLRPQSPPPSGDLRKGLQEYKGRYLRKFFRKVEKEATPFWLQPEYIGEKPKFTGFGGTPDVQLPDWLGKRERGRPKKS